MWIESHVKKDQMKTKYDCEWYSEVVRLESDNPLDSIAYITSGTAHISETKNAVISVPCTAGHRAVDFPPLFLSSPQVSGTPCVTEMATDKEWRQPYDLIREVKAQRTSQWTCMSAKPESQALSVSRWHVHSKQRLYIAIRNSERERIGEHSARVCSMQ